jgi:hypothetical protein
MPVRFQVLTAAIMKTADFWDIAPCSLVVVHLRFRGSYCFHHQVDKFTDVERVRTRGNVINTTTAATTRLNLVVE